MGANESGGAVGNAVRTVTQGGAPTPAPTPRRVKLLLIFFPHDV